jgi:hypothetical protein
LSRSRGIILWELLNTSASPRLALALDVTDRLVAKSIVKRKSGGKIINLASIYSIFGSGLRPRIMIWAEGD